MITNFIEDLKTELKRDLTQIGCKLSSNDSAEALLIRWYDYQLRRIAPAPRNVEESNEFKQSRSKLSAEEITALNAIIEELRRGDDVNGHLSKGILNADRPDLLMADWQIHHVHISNSKKSPGDFFFERGNNLAFAAVNRSNFYLLEIYPHGEENVWSKQDLLKIMKDSWPSLLTGRELTGKLEPDISISDAERQALRRANINVPTAIGDSIVFGPGGGVAADGTPVVTGRRANAVTNLPAELKLYFATPGIEEKVAAQVGLKSDDLSLKLEWDNGNIQIREKKSAKLLPLDRAEIRKVAAEFLKQEGQWERQKDGHDRFTIPGLFSEPGEPLGP